MSITQIDSSVNSVPVVEQGANTEMGKLDFLNLLATQLANQDPMDPMDSDTMTQQQVMYAELEQMINLNENMDEFMETQGDMMLGIASVFNTLESTGFLGKDVDLFTDKLTVTDDGVEGSIFYDLTQDAQVGYSILDENGNTIRTFAAEEVDAGNRLEIEWDGTNAAGDKVANGDYSIKLEVLDNEGVALTGKTYGSKNVKSVDFRSGTPLLTTSDGETVSVTDILSVLQPSS